MPTVLQHGLFASCLFFGMNENKCPVRKSSVNAQEVSKKLVWLAACRKRANIWVLCKKFILASKQQQINHLVFLESKVLIVYWYTEHCCWNCNILHVVMLALCSWSIEENSFWAVPAQHVYSSMMLNDCNLHIQILCHLVTFPSRKLVYLILIHIIRISS